MRVLTNIPDLDAGKVDYLISLSISVFWDSAQSCFLVPLEVTDEEILEALERYSEVLPDLTPRQFTLMLNRLHLREPIDELMGMLKQYDYQLWAEMEPEFTRSNVFFFEKTLWRLMQLGPAISQLNPELVITEEILRSAWKQGALS